jgi:hypothetical protein
MNRQDAELIYDLVTRVVASAVVGLNNGVIHPESAAKIREAREGFLKATEGKPGSGECICDQSPETLRRTCEERWFEPFEKTRANMILDHRCPKHGEKAQPALWGRHKEKTLSVTPAQWLSLGVTYK